VKAIVVKLGGSLLDWPYLAERLEAFMRRLTQPGLIVVGGGKLADRVRSWHRRHRLGSVPAHYLAVEAMGFNARLVASLADCFALATTWEACTAFWRAGRIPVADLVGWMHRNAWVFADAPPTWSVTSDSLAALLARRIDCRHLILLKSADPPREATAWCPEPISVWAKRGYVDSYFPAAAAGLERVEAINLRRWSPASSSMGVDQIG